jgi:hypothetical protein
MTKGELIHWHYASMTTEDRQVFNRWLTANAVIGSFFMLALFAMAIAGGPSSDRSLTNQASVKATSTVGRAAEASNHYSER